MFKSLNQSVRDLIESVVQVIYFMRGSIQYDDMMWRTPLERQIFAEFVEKRLESESKKHFPIY